MAEITRETFTTREPDRRSPVDVSVNNEATGSQTIEYFVYFFFGVLEILLAFRLLLRVMGAGTSSFFVRVIYSVTSIFILPFEGIFRRLLNQGAETTSVFEPSTLVALVVYIALAWGIVKLVRISSGQQQE